MKFELTEQQLQQLKLFLSRVELRGSEATALAILLQLLDKPIPEQKPILEPRPESKKK